jgi:hypothetical protein
MSNRVALDLASGPCVRRRVWHIYRTLMRAVGHLEDPRRRDQVAASWRSFFRQYTREVQALDVSGTPSAADSAAALTQKYLAECESRIRFLNTILPRKHRLLLADEEAGFLAQRYVQNDQGDLIAGSTRITSAHHRNLHVVDPIDLQRHQRLNDRFRFGARS